MESKRLQTKLSAEEPPGTHESNKRGKLADSKTEHDRSVNESPTFVRQIIWEKLKFSKTFYERTDKNIAKDIEDIAKIIYGWYGENCNVVFNGVGSCEHLQRAFAQDTIDKLTAFNNLSLIFIFASHPGFTSLIINRRNRGFFAYYVGYMASYLCNQLNEIIPGIQIQSFESLTDCNDSDSFILAFENARIINDALQSSQVMRMEQKLLKLRPTSQQIYQKKKEFVDALVSTYSTRLSPKVGNLESLLRTIETVCVEIVTTIIARRRANVDNYRIGVWSPLLLAVRSGRLDLVRVLINGGVDMNYEFRSDSSYFKDHLGIINLIIDEGEEINIGRISEADRDFKNAHFDILTALIGRDVRIRQHGALNAVTLAIRLEYSDIVHYLMKKGAMYNDNTIRLQEKKWLYFLNEKINPHRPDYYGETLLYYTLMGKHSEITSLLEKSVNSDEKCKNLLNALICAIYYGNVEVVETLVERSEVKVALENLKLLEIAIEWDYTEMVKFLIDMKTNSSEIRIANANDGYDLLKLAFKNNRKMVKLLIDLGVNTENMSLFPAFAVRWGRVSLMELLIDEGVDQLDAVNEIDGSALNFAITKGYLDIVETLLLRGANVNVMVEDGRFLMQSPSKQVLKCIVNHLAKLEAVDSNADEFDFKIIEKIHTNSRELDIVKIYQERFRICRTEIEKLNCENNSLHNFLKATDTHVLLNSWEALEGQFNKFDYAEYQDIEQRYPEYASILFNKANKTRREIFLCKHKPLIDILSVRYKRNMNQMEMFVLRKFLKRHAAEVVANFNEFEWLLTDFVDFGIKKRSVPRLETIAFAFGINLMITAKVSFISQQFRHIITNFNVADSQSFDEGYACSVISMQMK